MKSIYGGLALLFLICSAHATEISSSSTTASSPNRDYQMFVNESKWSIPHKVRINPMSTGYVVQFAGHANAGAYRINANFQKGDGEKTIPIHLSTRFTEGFMFYKIVMNNLRNGQWNETEVRANTAFWTDREFDLRVRFTNKTHFTAYGNRKEIGSFELRDDLSLVDHITIQGDLTLKGFRINAGINETKSPQIYSANLAPGQMLRVSGMPTGKEFKLRLEQTGELEKIPMEIKVNYEQSYIGRNSYINKMWAEEERSGGFPVAPNELIDITLIHEHNGHIQIYINDKKFKSYKKHFLGSTDSLHVLGDFELHTAAVSPAITI